MLERSRPLRLFTLFILYVGQGMPIGLFWFAIPAWMAVEGASAADVGYVAALTALPWSLKLVNGFFMDRYTWLPMGRRRIWILAAQSVMIALLCLGAAINPAASDVVILGVLGFGVNLATTFQDVAVDGLAVDIMSEDERARGSGMMFGGQSIGIATATAICGFVIEDFGAPAAFLIVAGIIFALTSPLFASATEKSGCLGMKAGPISATLISSSMHGGPFSNQPCFQWANWCRCCGCQCYLGAALCMAVSPGRPR